MNKAFDNFIWENYPNISTPLEKEFLNKINNGLDAVDTRVVTYDTTKFDTSEAQLLVKNVELNESSGVLKITHYNGSVSTYSSLLGKVAVNFDFNEETQKMIIYLSGGDRKEVDLSAFITDYEFVDTETIGFQTSADGKVSAIVKEGSIQEKHLRPDYLANVRSEVSKAEFASRNADTAAAEAGSNATLSKSWAVGDTGARPGENTDNSKYYYQQSKSIYDNFSQAGNVTGIKGNAESTYRTGNVNLTAANVGAAPSIVVESESFDNMIIPGLYSMNSPTSKKPDSDDEFGLLVLCSKNPSGYSNVIQIAHGRYNFSNIQLGNMYIRRGRGYVYTSSSSWEWTEWENMFQRDGNGNVIADTYLPLSGGIITGNLRLKGSGNYGNILNFGDNDYVHISEPTDDHLEIKGSYINFVTSATGTGRFTLNGKDILTIDKIYPIGSIYMSVNSTNPGTLFGGTWVRWGKGRVPVSVNESETEFNSVEKVGGSHYMQQHDHTPDTSGMGFLTYKYGSTIQRAQIQKNSSSGFYTHGANAVGDLGYSLKTSESGSGTSGNLQPYITCYMWKRTA